MAFFSNQQIDMPKNRTYHAYVPDTPVGPQLPAIIVFHGGGQEVETIALRWGINPPNPVPNLVEDYILIFPKSDPHLGDRWIHYKKSGYSNIPEHDLLFVDELVTEITTAGAFTVGGMQVSADPQRLYAAGFSNGAGLVWQIAYSNPVMATRFQGYATLGAGLTPDKAQLYRNRHGAPPPVPLIYIHGTADTSFSAPRTLQEVEIDTTYPAFTVREMQDRNGVIPGSPSTTQLFAGTTNSTEVVGQLYSGTQAFANVTIINGGHNWPTPTTAGNPPVATHFNATKAIIDFWQNFAGLP
jgi:poly(3-hydroxybutyrate) depolymerase